MNKTSKSVIKRGRPAKYNFGLLKKGKSFLFPLKIRDLVAPCAYIFAKKHGVTLRVLSLKKTFRVLRVA